MHEITRVRALCCECGNLRDVSARYAGRFEPADTARSTDDGNDPRGWRMTRTLKCSVCKAATVHALLCDHTQDHCDVPPDRGAQLTSKMLGALGFEIPAGALTGLNDDVMQWTNKELQTEAASRISRIMTTIAPEDLTLEECADLLALLQSVVDRRG